jgi:ornithine cyclodeaminase/alanine dehydrogenase-like protein (mu-crystallin family)
MIYITEDDVRRLLPMHSAIDCLRSAFLAYAKGEAQNQPRRRLFLRSGSVLHSMAAAFGKYFGTKVYSSNVKYGANFTFLLYDSETAKPLAQFEANYLGQIRTGAASGLAADLLAPRRPLDVAFLGSGFQAKTQFEAIAAVRSIASARVWSRTEATRQQFAAATGARAVNSAADACRDADVIVTATFAKDPVVPFAAVKSDALILAMGANAANRRELPEELVRKARVVADDVEQCRLEAGDLILADVDWDQVQSLASVVASNGKAGEDRRLTVFKSVGLALEDVAVAAFVYEQITLAPSSAGPSPATR